VPVPASPPPISSSIHEQELTAVGLDYLEASWRTDTPSDSTVCVFPANGAAFCKRQEQGQLYHVVRVHGLTPSSVYTYWLISNDERAAAVNDSDGDAPANPGQFTTLAPPPGKHVVDVALLTDLHVGETCSGSMLGVGGVAFPSCTVFPGYPNGSDRHGERMLAGAAAQIRALAPQMVIVLGDLTNNGAYTDMQTVKGLLDGMGLPYAVLRGNHDRPAQGGTGEADSCGSAKDCFSTVFRPNNQVRIQPVAVETRGVRFLLLDASDPSGNGNLTDATQQAWTSAELAAHPKSRTFILTHEPAGVYSNDTTLIPDFGMHPSNGGSWLHDIVTANPQVTATIAGHTHRNLLGYDDATGRTPWLEVGANKEYASGFSVLRIYEGGFVREYHRTDCAPGDDFCREWTSLTRAQQFGKQFSYMLGQLHARAFTFVDDCNHPTPKLASKAWEVGGDTGQDTSDCGGKILYPYP
jgi:3',5'-cyclic AMP phosphodiesterase CpdA